MSSCCTGTNYYYSVYIKYLNMNTQEATIPSGNCTPGRPERLRTVLSCHSLGFLLSILCRAMLSCFCLGLLLPSTDEHAVSESAYARINPYGYLTASAYARVFGMCELLIVLKMEDRTDV